MQWLTGPLIAIKRNIRINVRSLLKHLDEIHVELGQYDVIGLTETWLTPRANDLLLTLNTHFVIRQDRTTRTGNNKIKKGGGILLYIKKPLEQFVRILDCSICTANSEEIWVEIKKPGWKIVNMGFIYRPPNGDIKIFIKTLDYSLSEKIGKGNPNNKELYILSDLNVDYFRGKDTNRSKLRDLELKYNMRQIIKHPTRITAHSKSIIDLIYTTLPSDLILDSGVLDVNISDHLPVYIIKKKKRECHIKKCMYVRVHSMYSPDNFSNVIFDDTRWKSFWDLRLTPSELWELLITIVRDSLDKICPLKRIVVRDQQQNWFDGEINKAIMEKAALYKTAYKSNATEDWERARTAKKRARQLIVGKKRDYITNSLEENRPAPKKFWNDIQNNLYFGKIKSNVNQISVYTNLNELVTGAEAADHMNAYYVQVGPTLASKFDKTWESESNVAHWVDPNRNMSFLFIGVKETTSLIKSLSLINHPM